MTPFFIALTLTDILLLTLLVALPVRVAWWAKLLAIVVVFAFNFLAWSSTDSGRGWPTRESFPENSQFVSCSITEPDITTGTVGVIYVWMIPLDSNHGVLSYRPVGEEPRAYAEPYDRSLHEACVTAEKAQSRGISASIRKGRGRDGRHETSRFHAYVIPSPHLPRKGGAK